MTSFIFRACFALAAARGAFFSTRSTMRFSVIGMDLSWLRARRSKVCGADRQGSVRLDRSNNRAAGALLLGRGAPLPDL